MSKKDPLSAETLLEFFNVTTLDDYQVLAVLLYLLAALTIFLFVALFLNIMSPIEKKFPRYDVDVINPQYSQSVPYRTETLCGYGIPVPPRKWLTYQDFAFISSKEPVSIRGFLLDKDEAIFLHRASMCQNAIFGQEKSLFAERFAAPVESNSKSHEKRNSPEKLQKVGAEEKREQKEK